MGSVFAIVHDRRCGKRAWLVQFDAFGKSKAAILGRTLQQKPASPDVAVIRVDGLGTKSTA
jgi:hypothetical protein